MENIKIKAIAMALCFVFVTVSAFTIGSTRSLGSGRDYIGYGYWCPSGTLGVSGYVDTFPGGMSGGNLWCGWIDVQLSTTNNWWVQTGFVARVDTLWIEKYYIECNCSTGYHMVISTSGPTVNTVIPYYIYDMGANGFWNCYANGNYEGTFQTGIIYSPQLQGNSETSIDWPGPCCLNGTMESLLCYTTTPNSPNPNWYAWTSHFSDTTTPPMHITEYGNGHFSGWGPG